MSEEVRTRGRHLNHVAALYDPLIETLSFGREQRFREKTMAYMEFGAGDRILDVGCGTGSLTVQVAAGLQAPGRITGIDAAPRMIAIARRKAARLGVAADFEVGVAEHLEFGEQSFDLVVNSMFTHHIDTELKEKTFGEMFRVLKNGGRLITADIDRPSTWWAAMVGWSSRYLLLQPELEDNLRGDLPAIMAQAGFVNIERREQLYGLVSFFTCEKPGEEGT